MSSHLSLPHTDTKRWSAILQAVATPRTDVAGWHALMLECGGIDDGEEWRLQAFEAFITSDMDMKERHTFFESTLPFLQRLVLLCPDVQPLELLCQNENKTVNVCRTDIAILLACCFFNLFPRQALNINVRLPYNTFNFADACYFAAKSESQKAKFRCFFQYMECVQTRWDSLATQTFSVHRRALLQADRDRLSLTALVNNSSPLVPVAVISQPSARGVLDADEQLQVDFANEYIGGGALAGGNAQEEIMFALKPELLVAELVCEVLLPHEALVLIGSERFSDHTGFTSSFRYLGPCSTALSASSSASAHTYDSTGRLANAILAIDALIAWDLPGGFIGQFLPKYLLREVVKAYAAFSVPQSVLAHSYTGIATGNWGCGAFAGDAQLKAILQWIAASLQPVSSTDGTDWKALPLSYYTFNDASMREFETLVSGWGLTKRPTSGLTPCEHKNNGERHTAPAAPDVTVGSVFAALLEYGQEVARMDADVDVKPDLFEYLAQHVQIQQ